MSPRDTGETAPPPETTDTEAGWKDVATYWAANAFLLGVLAFAASILFDSGDAPSFWLRATLAVVVCVWGVVVVLGAASLGPGPAIGAVLDAKGGGAIWRDKLIARTDRFAGLEPDERRRFVFSTTLFDRALLIAVIYPFLLPLVGWSWTGNAVSLGEFELLSPETRLWVRAMLFGGFVPLLFVQVSKAIAKRRESSSAWWIMTGGVFFSLYSATEDISIAGTIAGAMAGLLLGAGAVAGTLGFGFAISSTKVSTTAIAVAAAGAIMLLPLKKKSSVWFALGYAVYIACLTAALAFAVVDQDWSDPKDRSRLLFLGILPLVNALFDFLSYAITFSLLRLGSTGILWRIGAALADAITAALLFLALGCTLIAVVDAMNAASGQVFFPLPDLFAALQTGETGRYWWVGAMVFSTLLPTGAHFLYACLGTITHAAFLAGPRLKPYVAKAASHPWAMVSAPAMVTFWALVWLAGFVAVVGLPAWLMLGGFDQMPGPLQDAVGGYLGLFVTFATWIGALP